MKLLNGLVNFFCVLSILFILWGIVSWMDIVADNRKPNPVHHPYNMFVLMTEGI